MAEKGNIWGDIAKALGMRKKKKVETPIAERNTKMNEAMKEIDADARPVYTDIDKPATPEPGTEGTRVKKKKSWLTFIKRR